MVNKNLKKTKCEICKKWQDSFICSYCVEYENEKLINGFKRKVKELKESEIPFQWISGGCDEDECKWIWNKLLLKIFGKQLTGEK